jgi:hypothetical protein
MMMFFKFTIEPFLGSHTFDFSNQTARTQQIQVPVYRAQQIQVPVYRAEAYPRRNTPHGLVYFACRGVAMGFI